MIATTACCFALSLCGRRANRMSCQSVTKITWCGWSEKCVYADVAAAEGWCSHLRAWANQVVQFYKGSAHGCGTKLIYICGLNFFQQVAPKYNFDIRDATRTTAEQKWCTCDLRLVAGLRIIPRLEECYQFITHISGWQAGRVGGAGLWLQNVPLYCIRYSSGNRCVTK